MKLSDALAHLAIEETRARRALGWERALGQAVVPGLLLAGLVGLGLIGVHASLPPLARSAFGYGGLLLVLGFAVLAARGFSPPTRAEGRARLAADAGFDPADLDALEDRPTRLDPVSTALWRAEQASAQAKLAHTKAKPPRPAFKRRDPWGLRYVAAVGVVLGLLVAGTRAPDRLAHVLAPNPGPLLGDTALTVEAWATPAAYTGQPSLSLGPGTDTSAPVPLPPQSELTVRLSGAEGAPRLHLSGPGPDQTIVFTKTPDGAWEAKVTVTQPALLRVSRFHTVARWHLQPAPDVPPQVRWTEIAGVEAEDKVRFAWTGTDDFGLEAALLRAVPVVPPPGLVGAAPFDLPIAAPAGSPKEAEAEASLDLREHPYAGLEVDVSVVIRDAQGQEGVTRPVRLTLPERMFLQPLARAAIEIRKQILHERRPYAPIRARGLAAFLPRNDVLTEGQTTPLDTADQRPTLERAPPGIKRAAVLLDSLTMLPEDGYFADRAVFLGFSFASRRLDVANDLTEADGAAEVLWDVAMRAEFGAAADARRALDQASRALRDAIARGADRQELARLTQTLRGASRAFTEALRQEALRDGQQPEQTEDTRETQGLTQRDLDAMMEEIQRLAEQGEPERAQQMLEQLEQMMANMQVRLTQSQTGEGEEEGSGGSGQGGDRGSNGALGEGVEGLSDAIGDQRGLREDTQGAQSGQSGSSPGALAERQSALRQQLGEAAGNTRRGGAEPGPEVGRAEQAMQEAEQALRRGDLQGASAAQEEALAQMRQAQTRLSEELARRNQEQQSGADGNATGPRDPLGRPTAGGDGERGETEVPMEAQRAQARDIVNELRRRAEDPARPEAERQYLRRLLDRFAEPGT